MSRWKSVVGGLAAILALSQPAKPQSIDAVVSSTNWWSDTERITLEVGTEIRYQDQTVSGIKVDFFPGHGNLVGIDAGNGTGVTFPDFSFHFNYHDIQDSFEVSNPPQFISDFRAALLLFNQYCGIGDQCIIGNPSVIRLRVPYKVHGEATIEATVTNSDWKMLQTYGVQGDAATVGSVDLVGKNVNSLRGFPFLPINSMTSVKGTVGFEADSKVEYGGETLFLKSGRFGLFGVGYGVGYKQESSRDNEYPHSVSASLSRKNNQLVFTPDVNVTVDETAHNRDSTQAKLFGIGNLDTSIPGFGFIFPMDFFLTGGLIAETSDSRSKHERTENTISGSSPLVRPNQLNGVYLSSHTLGSEKSANSSSSVNQILRTRIEVPIPSFGEIWYPLGGIMMKPFIGLGYESDTHMTAGDFGFFYLAYQLAGMAKINFKDSSQPFIQQENQSLSVVYTLWSPIKDIAERWMELYDDLDEIERYPVTRGLARKSRERDFFRTSPQFSLGVDAINEEITGKTTFGPFVVYSLGEDGWGRGRFLYDGKNFQTQLDLGFFWVSGGIGYTFEKDPTNDHIGTRTFGLGLSTALPGSETLLMVDVSKGLAQNADNYHAVLSVVPPHDTLDRLFR